ncbi:DHH family phosphoesterase [Faecalispora anaeroviscerum]|uniref:DHH family phosphoesterase n=1 Tax=Faecalispora anaeroviscerum TaxID=2991836 RepID=UPI0024B9D91C|nr:bifunctional oligoribonuclease/PAP phosphatase NrnA [Faecalispora anaeroviscerum]
MIDLDQAVSLLRGAEDIEILSHHYPDGDTLGCAAALCRALHLLGKRARCTCADPVSEKYSFLFEEIERQQFPAKFVVSVDVADSKLLGPVLAAKHAGKIDLCIDHHGSHQDFARNTYVDSTAAAACEIIYELVCRLGVVPDQVIAQAVYTGITTDTGCFRYSNTTARTHEIAAQVIRTGIDAGDINRQMFETKTRARLEMERSVLDSIVFYYDARCAVMRISREMIEASGADEADLDGLSAIPRQIEGVLVGVTMRERKIGGYKVSLRTQPQVNAAKICAQFGGGGHPAASGCTIEEDFEPAREKLLAAIGKVLETM